MGIVVVPTYGSDPATVTAANLDAKVAGLATEFNGSIDNDNIKAAAVIANSKLNLASISQAVAMSGGLTLSSTAQTMTLVPINEAKGADIASATTPNITSATGNTVHITGTTTITGFATGTAGIRRILIFDGILTFTHNSTSLILPTGANITTAAGDAAVMVSEGSGNWRCISYQRKDGTAVGGSYTPTAANALSGSVIQMVNQQVVTSSTTATVLPCDDTIPTNTEGAQFLTKSITPNNASNLLRIDVVIFGGEASDASNYWAAALFQDATSAALAAGASKSIQGATLWAEGISFTYWMTAGTTSSTTFNVRAGMGDAGTFTFNGASGRNLGGVLTSSITITEIKA